MFFPNILQKIISILFFPITIIYCIVVAYKRNSAKPLDFNINIVSIGNLVLGGSGKTPVTIALAKEKENVAIILRGYGRNSKGLHVVSQNGKILIDINKSGDEARLLANSLPNAIVIVSENRVKGVIKAKELGAKLIFLDDGYSAHNIKKFDILIRPKEEPTNIFCLPSGGYRETKMMYSFVPVVLRDGVDFTRIISFTQENKEITILPKKLLLLTAISKANRLFEYLPKNVKSEIFIDHHNYTNTEINNILNDNKDYTIVTTQKDIVKLEQYKIKNIIIMNLEIKINKKIDFKF